MTIGYITALRNARLDAISINSPDTTIVIDGGAPGTTLSAKNNIEIGGTPYKDCRTIYITVI